MSHSPAPWKFVESISNDEVPYDFRPNRHCYNPSIIDAGGNEVVGCDEYNVFSTPENVRLLVHAPELLDVLEDLLRDIDTIDSYAINETVLPMWEDIERGKALVAKLRGTL